MRSYKTTTIHFTFPADKDPREAISYLSEVFNKSKVDYSKEQQYIPHNDGSMSLSKPIKDGYKAEWIPTDYLPF